MESTVEIIDRKTDNPKLLVKPVRGKAFTLTFDEAGELIYLMRQRIYEMVER